MKRMEANVDRMKAQLKRWHTGLDKLTVRAEAAERHVRTHYRRHVENARASRASARATINVFKEAGGDTWESFRAGFMAAWNDVEAVFKVLKPKRGSRKPTGSATTVNKQTAHRSAKRPSGK
jgi:hypothetical protein